MVANQQPPPKYDFNDADSIGDVPPPPPVNNFEDDSHMMDYDESTAFTSEGGPGSLQSRPSKKWRVLKKEAEHALVPQDDPLNNGSNAPNNVPMQGHFRGIQNAQDFDEEEAGMVEIEVPSSSVVARLNENEVNRVKRRRMVKFGLIGLCCFAVIAAIAGGVTSASRPKGIAGVEQANDGTGTGGDGTGTGGDGTGDNLDNDTIDHDNVTPEPEVPIDPVDTPAGKFASTIVSLDNDNAAAALDWMVNDPANDAYDFKTEAAFFDADTQIVFKQRFAAATLFTALSAGNTEEDPWLNSDGWMTDADVCEWYGVSCGAYDGRRRTTDVNSNIITKIDLSTNNMAGPIPSEIALFEDMDTIILTENWLTGPIPEELYGMTQLLDLDLYDNELTGEISSQIGNLEGLQVLYLGINKFEGEIPSSIQNLQSLRVAWFDFNNFGGNIPDFPDSVEDVDLKDNTFIGQIPESLITGQNIEKIDVSGNWLTGQLPEAFSTSLRELRISDNIMSGEIPSVLGELENLEILHLDNNNYDDTNGLTGTQSNGFTSWIPLSISTSESLIEVRLENNDLKGQIFDLPDGICSRDDFFINAFCGEEPCENDGCCECKEYSIPKMT